MQNKRCDWAGDDPLMIAYHDTEWGVPLHDDQKLFELLVLEGAQAGLSWRTVLHKRERYREVFKGFNPAAVARMKESSVDRLMKDGGLIRNRLKLSSVSVNARAFIQVQREFGSFHAFLWDLAGGKPIQNNPKTMKEIAAESEIGHRLSKELRKRGFRFVGPLVCHAYLQACGVIDDHLVSCHCKKKLS